MNRISLTDLAKNEPMEPLLEKEVQVRAYERYEQRGKGHGFALQDWLEAEAEVLARFFSPLRQCDSPLRQFLSRAEQEAVPRHDRSGDQRRRRSKAGVLVIESLGLGIALQPGATGLRRDRSSRGGGFASAI